MQENKNVKAPVEVSEEDQLIEQARIRREKLAKLVSEGKNPYEMVKYPVDADSETIKNNFEAYEGKTVAIGEPHALFSDVERMTALGLDVPLRRKLSRR